MAKFKREVVVIGDGDVEITSLKGSDALILMDEERSILDSGIVCLRLNQDQLDELIEKLQKFQRREIWKGKKAGQKGCG